MAQHYQHGRVRRASRSCVRATLLLVMLGASSVKAQSAPPVPAVIAATPTSIENVNNIKAQPLALLAKFPDAGPAMASYVAKELTQQPAMIDAILSVVSDMSPAQASATGAGMVRATRALGPKQGASAREISEKVMRSDNKYLTTTYASLGPRYNSNAAFNAPNALPPRQIIALGEMGLGIGGVWRVGLTENENFTGKSGSGNDAIGGTKCRGYNTVYAKGSCHGMIVAMIASDAPQNGAVSTSP